MSLKNWLANGWLIEHKTSPQEITGLLEVADRDLKDCRSPGLSSDWQLNIAYNAALQAATAALAAAGYRTSREAHHYRVIQSIAYTIGAEPNLVNQFDQFRKKRNISGYELSGAISQQEANEMISLAKRIREDVETWLRKNYSELIV
jgi:HEPN domain-containing protein